MAKKTCSECGAVRGTPHLDSCSGAAYRGDKRDGVVRSAGGVVRSRLPLKKAEIEEGLKVSRATGRESLHTPMDRPPPGMTMPDDGEITIAIFDNASEEPISVHKGAFDEPVPGDLLVDGEKHWRAVRVLAVHEHGHYNVFVTEEGVPVFETGYDYAAAEERLVESAGLEMQETKGEDK